MNDTTELEPQTTAVEPKEGATDTLGETPVSAGEPSETPQPPAQVEQTPADAGNDFDPNAAIDVFDPNAIVTNTNSATDFSHLVTGVDEQTSAAVHKEIAQGSFGSLDVNDFKDFNANSKVVQQGTYLFSVEQRYLQHGTDLTNQTVSMAKGGFGAIKVSIYENRLRLATFNQLAFMEAFIPLAKPAEGLGDSEEISFVFDQGVLRKIARSFGDAVINFELIAERQLLKISSGTTELALGTYGQVEFVDYHSRLGKPTYLAKIDPAIYAKGIDYASKFSDRDEIQPQMSVLDLHDQSITGGSTTAMGNLKAAAFGDVSLRVKYEAIKLVAAVLPKFDKDNTHLFETESFYIIRDTTLYFGFEKSQHQFPNIAPILALKGANYSLAPRAALQSSVTRLSVVSTDRDLLIKVQIEGQANDGQITLSTEDASGKQSSDHFSVANFGQPLTEPQTFFVNAGQLLKTINYFDSANVHLELLAGKALAIRDEQEGVFETTTVLTVMSPEKVQQLRAEREAAKQSKAGAVKE